MSLRQAFPPTQVVDVVSLLPIMAAVLTGFVVVGLALPVLPLHVHQGLGFSTFVVGLVAGSQFAASLFSRVWAGSYADRHGAKPGVILGLLAATASGVLYLVSLGFIEAPLASITIYSPAAHCWARPRAS